MPAGTAARASAYLEAVARGEAELLRRGAFALPHSRWSLGQHLRATCNILERWRQSDELCLAGLVHSVYSTDTFTAELISTAERPRVREAVGFEAERLAYMFCAIERRDYLTRPLERGARLRNRFTGESGAVSAADLRGLRTLHLANAAEQACAEDGSPAPWLARASEVARLLDDATLPPLLRDGLAAIDAALERSAIEAYARAVRASHAELDEALAALAQIVERLPVGETALAPGLFALAQRRYGEAAGAGRLARERFEAWGTPWDKRLALEAWIELAKMLEELSDSTAAARDFLAARTNELVARYGLDPVALHARLRAVDALPHAPQHDDAERHVAPSNEPARSDLPPRFARYVAGLRAARSAGLAHYPGLRAQPWYDPAEFPLARELEAAASEVRREFEGIPPRAFHRESERLEREGDWDVFMLFERGEKRAENCALVPRTTALIERHRTVRGMAGLAYFSRLAPGATIAPHMGPTNLRVRLHLGLVVPEGCSIRVGTERRTWSEGRCLVFDDSFEHEVENRSERERIVLIVDLWHPDLGDEEVELIEAVHGVVERSARSLAEYWAHNERARALGTPR